MGQEFWSFFFFESSLIIRAHRVFAVLRNAPLIRQKGNIETAVSQTACPPGRPRSVRTRDSVEVLRCSRRRSTWKLSQALNIRSNKAGDDLHICPYKTQVVQELCEFYKRRKTELCNAFLGVFVEEAESCTCWQIMLDGAISTLQ